MKDIYHLFLKKIAHFQVEYPVLTLLLILSLTLAIYSGVSKVRTVASLEQMMPKDIEEIKAFNTLRDNHMGQDMIAIILTIDRDAINGIQDIRDPRVYDYVDYLSSKIQKEPDALSVYSMRYGENYINSDYTTTMILISTDVAADDPRMKSLAENIINHVDSAGHPPGIKIQFTGTPIIQQRLGELIAKDRKDTQWISTLLVFIITMIIFGSFSSAVVPIVIVTISVTWLYGTMGYNDLPISTLAGGVAAMVIGIGIDFAIHIMNKFRYERKNNSMKKSIENAVVHTGTALTASSMTTIVAFLAFLVGRMPEMGRFGMLMAIGISYSLLFSLFGLPALLVLEERCIYWLKDRLRFGLERELKLEVEG